MVPARLVRVAKNNGKKGRPVFGLPFWVLIWASLAEEGGDIIVDDQRREDDRNGGQKLDQDVDRRAGGIFERVAHGVADDGGLVVFTALAAEVAGLDVLFAVIPGAAGVRHHDRQDESGGGRAHQHAGHAFHAEDQAQHDRDDGGEKRGSENLLLSGLGAQVNAAFVIRLRGTFHEALDLPELAADFGDDALRGLRNRGHGHRGENERQDRADEQADQNRRVHD